MKIYRCMHEAICNEHGKQLLLIWFINYLPLTKFHIVNPVWAISTLIITSCCTCHNYICNLFLNGILAGASVSYGHFSSCCFFFFFLVFYLFIFFLFMFFFFFLQKSGPADISLMFICCKDPDQTVWMLIMLSYQTSLIPHSS